jgi:signal transduction histidine kinase
MQVITNILSTAVKYSSKADKVILRTSFELNHSPNLPRVTVSIQDFGNGISENDQALKFERFVRGKDKDTNLIPGLGSGLYISANIIKKHNGPYMGKVKNWGGINIWI